MGKATPQIAVYTMRIRRDRLEALHEIAEAEYRSVHDLLKLIIDEAIERRQPKDDATS